MHRRNGSKGAIHHARASGQIDFGRKPRAQYPRTLRDGTVVTGIKISPEQGLAMVDGRHPDGSPFSRVCDLRSLGLNL
jgi:hypothetical protein